MAEGRDKARTEGGLKREFPAAPSDPRSIANANDKADLVELDADGPGPDADFLAKELKRLVVGQDEAVEQVAAFYQQSKAGLSPPGRPVGSFLFLGPTGSGKTKTVEALAEVLVKDPRAVIKIDCAEFQHSHEIAKLIGSPPGYLGHRETHPLLSQEVLNQHHTEKLKISFLLFDEIEKASDSLWNLLLGILDKANLTLGDNRRVDFSRAMIFMTSNLGAEEMKNLVRKKMGFPQDSLSPEKLAQKLEKSAVEAARRKFTPEFMNRLDKVVVFKPLGNDDLRHILDIELDYVQQRIHTSGKQVSVSVTSGAKDQILREAAPDIKYGVRELKRVVEQQVTKKLGGLIAKNLLDRGNAVTIDYKDGRFIFSKLNCATIERAAYGHLVISAPGGVVMTKPAPEIGDEMEDGTVYAGFYEGKPLYTTPRDAPGTYTFNEAAKYAKSLDAHGRHDLRAPSKGELNVLWTNRNKGKLAGTFNETGSYWSSSQGGTSSAWDQRFSNGAQSLDNKGGYLSLRCVR